MSNNKRFQVNSKKDYLIYLRMIIIQGQKLLNTYQKYLKDLKETVQFHNLFEEPNNKINAAVYEENNDKIQFIEHKLLNLFGDMQNDSISYNKFKRRLVKRNIEVKEIIGSLPNELSEMLNVMNTSRNWGLHEPESLLIAHLENIKKQWSKEEVENYLNDFQKIHIPFFDKYEGKWLISLYESCNTNYEFYTSLFEYILDDYKVLLGETSEFEIIYNNYELRDFEKEIVLSKTSFEIQNGKYKGAN
ncbi:hypothetical protein [Bacillus mycoides]|uniref:hypothetical protein n=1 Tax=Bacillus mycoides TaxID=1405 RepID=UPI003558B5B0